jgi:heavy metal sensor kinase
MRILAAARSWFWRVLRRARGLRVRLAVSYVLFFAILLAGTGWFFRVTLAKTASDRSAAVLAEEWAAIKGYLTISPLGDAAWDYDKDDPEESFIVERLRRILYVYDPVRKETVEISNGYLALGEDSEADIAAVLRSREPITLTKYNSHDEPYLVRQGILRDAGRTYFLAIGLPVSDRERILADFTRAYILFMPAMLALSVLLGGYLSGRALRPVNELAGATQRISGSNLSLRLRPRDTGDEIDALIHTFNGMMGRLEANFEQMRQFTTDASHELRTPLTAIRGQLEVALFTARSEADYRAAMENALMDVERLGQIVKSLLLLSQAESGQLALQVTVADLAPIARDIIGQFDLPADEKQITIEAALDAPCPAPVDRVQFERLLSNLLSNAVRYTQPGGHVRVGLTRRNGSVALTVADNGPGIPAEHIPRIFERFYRIPHRDAGPDQGLGVGLSFVAWIARAHGGTVTVTSPPGAGATFEVLLPAPEIPLHAEGLEAK